MDLALERDKRGGRVVRRRRDTFRAARVLLTQALEASTTAAYRFEDDSLEGLTHGIDLTAAINWRIGLFMLSFELEYDLLDLPSSSDEGFTAWLKLRREIPLIGRPRR